MGELAMPRTDTMDRSHLSRRVTKRIMDLSIAFTAFVILLPLMLTISVLVALDSRGPILFKQKRIGRGGRLFTFYKFRSMYSGVDHHPHREAFRNFAEGRAGDRQGGQPLFKPSDDRRVTRLGRLLRATSLDELPQLINVLNGDMSIVGPRPAIPYELEFYESEHCRRFSVRPGITGLWQVMGRSRVTFREMIDMDIQYVDSSSPWLDISIMLRTVPVVLMRKGGY